MPTRPAVRATALAVAVLGIAGAARADDTVGTPGDHPRYAVEVEPHLLLGWDSLFPGSSYGVGARFSIPVVFNGFIPTINNSVAVSFGAELLHYDGCYIPGASCTANFLVLPAALQWNFFVAKHWSVFGEPGLFVYHGFFDTTCPRNAQCIVPSDTGIQPSFYVGARYHFSESVALTMRAGYPTVSVGVSFL